MSAATMTRREFVGWMVASVAAMIAGSRVWRLFRQLVEDEGYLVGQFHKGDPIALVRGDQSAAYGVVKAIDARLGTITIAWEQRNGRFAESDLVVFA